MTNLEIISVPPYGDYGYSGSLIVRATVSEGFYVPELYLTTTSYYGGEQMVQTNRTGWKSSGVFETYFTLFRVTEFSGLSFKEERIYNYVEVYGLYVRGVGISPQAGSWELDANGEILTDVDGIGRFSLPYGTQCTLTANVNKGYKFLRWADSSGEIITTQKTYSFQPKINRHDASYHPDFNGYAEKSGGLILHGKLKTILHGANGTILTDN